MPVSDKKSEKPRRSSVGNVKKTKKFLGKVAIITGASSGIGRATAELFASYGASIAITGRSYRCGRCTGTGIDLIGAPINFEETKQLAIKAGLKEDKILLIVADVTKEADTTRIVAETIKKFEKLNILVNNAGAGNMDGYPDSSIAQPLLAYDYVNNLNARSVIAMCQQAIPHLKATKGNIVNISSVGSITPSPNYMYYQMAKASVDHFTRILAVQLAGDGVRVNAINPGAVRTNWMARTGVSESAKDMMENTVLPQMIPLKRVGEASEIAATIAFLASDDASYITGRMLVADGGVSIASFGGLARDLAHTAAITDGVKDL